MNIVRLQNAGVKQLLVLLFTYENKHYNFSKYCNNTDSFTIIYLFNILYKYLFLKCFLFHCISISIKC